MIYLFGAGTLAMGVSGHLAWALGEPLIFPSLGPTVYLLFGTPMAEAASPRNTVLGHFIGVAVALALLAAFGLLTDPGDPEGG